MTLARERWSDTDLLGRTEFTATGRIPKAGRVGIELRSMRVIGLGLVAVLGARKSLSVWICRCEARRCGKSNGDSRRGAFARGHEPSRAFLPRDRTFGDAVLYFAITNAVRRTDAGAKNQRARQQQARQQQEACREGHSDTTRTKDDLFHLTLPRS
jgi:hypothetical protein